MLQWNSPELDKKEFDEFVWNIDKQIPKDE